MLLLRKTASLATGATLLQALLGAATGTASLAASLLLATPAASADRAMPLVALDPRDGRARIDELRPKVKAAPGDLKLARELGILLHIANEKKRTRAEVDEAIALLKKVVKADPKDLEAAAWLGSLVTMQAEGETNPGKQTLYVKQGCRQMDQAVKAQPEDVPIRLIRAYNSLTLPKFLERTRFAVEDFEFIKTYCAKQPCQDGRIAQAEAGLKQAKEMMN